MQKQQQQQFHKNLSRPALLVLNSLVDGPMHAVAVREAIEQATGIFIEPGTLYRALAQLEQDGRIEVLASEGQLCRYAITAFGLLALQSANLNSYEQQDAESPGWLRGREIIMRLVLWMLRFKASFVLAHYPRNASF